MNLAEVSYGFGAGMGAGRVQLTDRCKGCGGTKRIDEVCCQAGTLVAERDERELRGRAIRARRQPANDELGWF
jgi:hypothetical protein